jgi:hypothetical protein
VERIYAAAQLQEPLPLTSGAIQQGEPMNDCMLLCACCHVSLLLLGVAAEPRSASTTPHSEPTKMLPALMSLRGVGGGWVRQGQLLQLAGI